MRVSDLMLDILAAHGVRDLFGVPGGAIDDVTDAIRRHDAMRFILVRHEEAGAFMASAQAKLSGRLSASLGTADPSAILDHAPVIPTTGAGSTAARGRR